MRKHVHLTLICPILLAACAANPLTPAAQHIRIVTAEPAGCEYLGEVTGNQGNFFTGDFTSNANLETGARNEMKNEAAKLGANTVQLLTSRAGQTGSMSMSNGTGSGHTAETNMTYSGIAYKCSGT